MILKVLHTIKRSLLCQQLNFIIDDADGDQITAENTDDSNHETDIKHGVPLREQDRFLPIANVAKIQLFAKLFL